jgi:hypothetical protein
MFLEQVVVHPRITDHIKALVVVVDVPDGDIEPKQILLQRE